MCLWRNELYFCGVYDCLITSVSQQISALIFTIICAFTRVDQTTHFGADQNVNRYIIVYVVGCELATLH